MAVVRGVGQIVGVTARPIMRLSPEVGVAESERCVGEAPVVTKAGIPRSHAVAEATPPVTEAKAERRTVPSVAIAEANRPAVKVAAPIVSAVVEWIVVVPSEMAGIAVASVRKAVLVALSVVALFGVVPILSIDFVLVHDAPVGRLGVDALGHDALRANRAVRRVDGRELGIAAR